MLSTLLLCSVLAVPAPPAAAVQDAPAQDAPAKKADKAEGKTIAQLERAVRAAERKVRQAELERALTELKSAEEVSRARMAIDDKVLAVELAQRELEIYERFDQPAALETAELSVDRAESRLVSQKQDLEGILRIYAEEEEAPAKNEIIRRHEVSVAFAEREVAASKQRHAKAKADVALAIDKKRHAIDKAKRELELAERGRRRAELSTELAAMKAKDAVESSVEALEDARGALEKRAAELAADGEEK